jgi:succinate dehydrogenase/fumarate reductase-like Fe-S protein
MTGEREAAGLREAIRETLVREWRDDYSVASIVDALTAAVTNLTPAPVTGETTDAGEGEGLTDAERAQVYDAARCLDCGVTAVDDEEPGLWLAVERIVAARVSAAATRAADDRAERIADRFEVLGMYSAARIARTTP